MTDDEILQLANEVLVPAGIHGAQIRRSPRTTDGAGYQAITVRLSLQAPDGKPDTTFHSGWRTYPETIPQQPDKAMISAAARDLISYIVKTTATWPTPWKPANAA